jgi:putative hydrolase of the HAD superfamily
VSAAADGERATRAFDGVLFDIDDTLVDTHGAFATALAAVTAQYLPDLPPERHAEVVAVWRADAGGHYRRYTSGRAGYREQRMARANALLAAFGGAPLDDAAYDAWNAVFEHGFQGAWAAHDDAVATVRELLDAGLVVGALSNASVEYQSLKLARVGLADHVPMLVGVDTLGVGKPDPRVFAEACRRLGTAPERTVYVGDELDVDARAAQEAGLRGVWLDRPGVRRGGQFVEDPEVARAAGLIRIRSLRDLPPALGLST